MLNRPDGLLRAASKLYLTYFPRAVRPETLVSTDRDELRAYIRGRRERSVLKPLAGTHGQGCSRSRPTTPTSA